jgi:hypothetical protein
MQSKAVETSGDPIRKAQPLECHAAANPASYSVFNLTRNITHQRSRPKSQISGRVE